MHTVGPQRGDYKFINNARNRKKYMAKSAAQSREKFVTRAGAASQDYVQGAESTTKDQSAAAVAAAPNYAAGVQAAIGRGAYQKGLQASGKAGWLKGVKEKGGNRFAEGVASGADKYVANSSKYDGARNSAASLPRGPKGSEANFLRSKTVGMNLRKQKVG